ncbi:MAG: lysylphosphatidylglycerol synthase transmembrane domain-containing protein [Planctomycetota bacterium]
MKRYRLLLSLIVAVVFFSAVLWFSGVHPVEVVELLSQCDPLLILAALIAYVASYCGRALRFKILLREDSLPFTCLFSTVTVHNLFNAVLPARTGELSYIILLKNKFNISTAAGVATLVVARVLDLLCLMLFLGIGFAFYGARIELFDSYLTISITCLSVIFISIALLFNLARITSFCLSGFKSVTKKLKLEERRMVVFVLEKGQAVCHAFQSIESRSLMLSAFAITSGVWFCTYLTCYCILISFNVVDPLVFTFGISIVGTTALHATCILPLNSFGNLGTWEAGWAAGYILIGMDEKLAVQTGMGEHLIIFAFLFILGLVGWLSLHQRHDKG